MCTGLFSCYFFSSRRRHTRLTCDWSSDVCSSDLGGSACRRGLGWFEGPDFLLLPISVCAACVLPYALLWPGEIPLHLQRTADRDTPTDQHHLDGSLFGNCSISSGRLAVCRLFRFRI